MFIFLVFFQTFIEYLELAENTAYHKMPPTHCFGQYRYGLVTYGHLNGQRKNIGIQWTDRSYQLGKGRLLCHPMYCN